MAQGDALHRSPSVDLPWRPQNVASLLGAVSEMVEGFSIARGVARFLLCRPVPWLFWGRCRVTTSSRRL